MALFFAMHATPVPGAFLDAGVQAPPLGIGLAAIGRPGYINLRRGAEFDQLGERSLDAMERRCHEVLDAAYASGVRYFDCARSYGEAERFMGTWLASRGLAGRADLLVGSKWGYKFTAGWRVDTRGAPHEVKDHSLAHLREQSAESARLLGGHLSLYQIHSATLESGVLDDGAVLDELRAIRAARGWRIGLSVSGPRQADVIRKALALEPPLFDCVQATYNLLEQSAAPALDEARAAGVVVIVKEAMANGRLLQPGRPAADAVREVAARLDVPADALCLAVVMRQGFAPMVLSGAATAEQARSNARALELAADARLDDATVGALVGSCRMDPAEYWAERGRLEWN
ncbi:hypothetical protein KFE25_013498 [Diacronema lutheri]|uniref:NADP-dependent oxidoreductase domain-containing protein n=1 Tax=Diacronema lutheri TaxID=2081491 RepID=A0A8J5XZI1_DIALT|nr:hypothetical protein KFE25_013498 [Diacronema lutheri]